MNKIIAVLFTLFISVSSFAQGSIEPELKKSQFRVALLPLGISFEQKIGSKQTVNFIGGLAVSAHAYSDSFQGSKFDIFFAPTFSGEFRNFYNRKNVTLELEANSGNYFGLSAGHTMDRLGSKENVLFIEESIENSYYVGPVWGIQRNYKTGFHLNLSMGLGYQSGDYIDSKVAFIGSGAIGIFFK